METEDLKSILIPLGTLWITLTTMVSTARFVNEMRDTVILGYKDSKKLNKLHRGAIYFDWYLSMVAAVFAAFLFGGLLIWMGTQFTAGSGVRICLYVVSAYPLMCGILFTICGLSDRRVMRTEIDIDDDSPELEDAN